MILTSGFFKFPLMGFLYNKEFTKWVTKGNENKFLYQTDITYRVKHLNEKYIYVESVCFLKDTLN